LLSHAASHSSKTTLKCPFIQVLSYKALGDHNYQCLGAISLRVCRLV
jgi:hypothetical protein